jgi:hypothetical protein
MKKVVLIVAAAGMLLAGCGYGGGGGTQGEVDFALENTLGEPRYVNWSAGAGGVFSCRTGGNDCRFYPPACTDECTEQNLDQNCCMDCGAFMPAVKVIDPGDTLMIRWLGKLYPYDETHCSDCECYRIEDAAPGSYRAEICVYADYECDMPPCDAPDAQGVIMGASPADAPDCIGVDFSVPYTKQYLILSIQ